MFVLFFFAGGASDEKRRGRLRGDYKPSSASKNALTSQMLVILTVTSVRSNMQALFQV
jgi:hypothetical protein